MLTRLWIIGFFAVMLLLLWLAVRGIRPHQGMHAAMESIFIGALLCLGLSLLLRPAGFSLPTGPLPSVLAGTLGFPGAALAFWMSSGL